MTDDFNAKNSNDKTGSCDSEEKIAMLERKVGQLTLNNDFLKKILGVSEKERFMMVERNEKNRGLVVNFKRIKRIMKDNKISAILPNLTL